MMKVVLASKNAHKLKEISKITEKFDMELVLESQLGVDIDVEETGSTFEENSFIKAEAVMKATGLPALADDSGIAVDALNGEPGIYSARYGFDQSLDDWGRLELLLKNTEQVPDSSRQAQFVCVITLVTPEGQVIQARGEAHGELLRQPAGGTAPQRICPGGDSRNWGRSRSPLLLPVAAAAPHEPLLWPGLPVPPGSQGY